MLLVKASPILILLILLPAVAFAETFTSGTFKIDYPDDWTLIKHETKEPQAITAIATILDRTDPSEITNIHILSESAPGSTLAGYFDLNLYQIKQSYGAYDLVIHDQGTRTINNNQSYFVQYSWMQTLPNGTSIKLVSKQFVLQHEDLFYDIIYTQPEIFTKFSTIQFDDLVSSLQFLTKEEAEKLKDKTSNKGGGCLIATAAYGSELAPQVQTLRELRDNVLLETDSGSAFMTGFNSIYYSFSPAVADWERQNPIFKEAVKIAITPLVSTLSILNYIEMDSEIHVIVYGLGIIFLNTGIYLGLPALVVLNLKRSK